MKNRNLLLFFLIAIFLSGCATSNKLKDVQDIAIQPVLSNAVDSMSYAFGVQVGSDFAENIKILPGGEANKDLLIKGFSQALKADTNMWMDKTAAQEYFNKYLKKEKEKEDNMKKELGENFLAENKLNEGVVETSSGLQYQIITLGEGAKPTSSSKVRVHYEGRTIDGNKFDSSIDRGEPTEFFLHQVIAGWTEGVQLMPIGSKFKFFIPYNLAYGERGIPQAGIAPFSPLIFEVELIDIVE